MQEFKNKKKRKHGSGTTTLKISDEEMNDIMKIVQAFEGLIFCWKELLKQLKMKQKGGFLSILLGTLGESLLGNLLSEKEM